MADLIIVLARTSKDASNRRHGLSLLVVEDGMAGSPRAAVSTSSAWTCKTRSNSPSTTSGCPSAISSERRTSHSRISATISPGTVALATGAVAQTSVALELTKSYVTQRSVFGTTVSSFQNTKFELAAVATEVQAAQTFLDRGIAELSQRRLGAADAAMIKLFCTEVQGRSIDRCLQLFGGYGYVREYPIARLYADARVTRIYGGTSEVMKSIISKSLGL